MISLIRRVALCAATSCCLFLLFAAGASASMIQPVKAVATPNQIDGSYEATATCPAGRKVVSGGFFSPQSPSVVINKAVGAKSWTVKAFDTDTISAVAYCSKYVKGITVSTAVGALDQNPSGNPNGGDRQGEVTATCPNGSKVASGGWEYADPTENSPVFTSRPVNSNGWKLSAASSSSGDSITAYAYCLTGKKLKIRAGAVAPTMSSTKAAAHGSAGKHRGLPAATPVATASCEPGETAFGGGFETTPTPDFSNEAGPDTFFGKSARFSGNGWKARAIDFSSFNGGEIRAFAICREPGA